MINILVLEDSAANAETVRAAILESAGLDAVAVDIVPDVVSAKAKLRTSAYDALLVDIQVPIRYGESIDPQGGVRLLEEIVASTHLKRPAYIVGLTEHSEAFLHASPVFAQNLFVIIERISGSDAWREQLFGFIRHVAAAAQIRNAPELEEGFRSSLAIVCALDVPELKAILELPCGWTDITHTSCNPTYETILVAASGKHRVIATSALEMGMAAAAALCGKTTERFKPRFLAMTGIAAGIKGEMHFGDVIIADSCWDYSAGKVVETDGALALEMEPRTGLLDPTVKSQFQRISKDADALDELLTSYKGGERPPLPPSMHIGPLFTGTQVITSELRARQLKDQNRKIKGIDMEAYSVFAAARYAEQPRPTALVLKSVSDFADPSKADKWRPYASHTSARMLYTWAMRFL